MECALAHTGAMALPTFDQAKINSAYPHKPLKNQTALVTGANSGIGEGASRYLAAAGANVVVNYVVNPEAAEAIVADLLAHGGQAIAIQADVSKEDQVQAMFAKAVEAFGTIDICVPNAGLQRDAALVDMTMQQWQFVLDVNLTGQFLCCREAVKEFLRRGPRPEVSAATGKIVCMSSVHEVIPWATHVNYATSKGGIMLMMKSIAQEVAKHKVRVNSIGPGAIKTPINTAAWSTAEAEEKLLQLIPYDRVGLPDDIGKAVVWLASDESDYVTGITLFVDGGMTLYEGFATNG